jgi:hypothetical protein
MFWRMVSCLGTGIEGSFGFSFFINMFFEYLFDYIVVLFEYFMKACNRDHLLTAFVCMSYNEGVLDFRYKQYMFKNYQDLNH